MTPDIAAVVFDLGGTLIEYAGTYQGWPELESPGLDAAYAFLAGQGAALPRLADFRQEAFQRLPPRWKEATEGGRNLRLAGFLSELVDEPLSPELISGAAAVYEAAICGQGVLIEGGRETVRTLRDAGYRIGLLSNTMFSGSAHLADLDRFELTEYFDAMLFSADAGMWKPDAAPYLQLLEDLGVSPANAVFVGDSPEHDIVGAARAGMYSVFYRSSGRFGQPGTGVQSDAVIDDLRELPHLLTSWSRSS